MKKMLTFMLMVTMSLSATLFTSCDTDDQYEASLLINGDWQGYLGEYYFDRWGMSGTTYETVMRFGGRGSGSTSGRGYEVDYDTRSPFRDYAYCEFTWSIVEGVITLIYDDSAWTPVYISRYTLHSDYFAGYMDDGTRRDIKFRFKNVHFDYWDDYRRGGYYYDYRDDYYYSRTRGESPDATVPLPYKNNGKSILSGSFAR